MRGASGTVTLAIRMKSVSSLPDILRYSNDSEPGILRLKKGKTYRYEDTKGRTIKCEKVLERISLLGLPPAYRDVWICQDEFGHLQATGRDVKGRKQYRYHSQWRAFQDRKKFENLLAFGHHLTYLRRKISRDLRRQDNSKIFVCAAITRLIDKGALRIGHSQNEAVGASTLRQKHISLTSNSLKLDYKAKGGKRVRKQIKDKTLARVLGRIDDLPGRRLFQYIGDDGQVYGLDSSHVNGYLGEDFTAKTFRTWHGTLAAFECALETEGEPTIKALSEAAAARLHNTPTICRNSYIHPKVIALSDKNTAAKSKEMDARGLCKSERMLLSFLED